MGVVLKTFMYRPDWYAFSILFYKWNARRSVRTENMQDFMDNLHNQHVGQGKPSDYCCIHFAPSMLSSTV